MTQAIGDVEALTAAVIGTVVTPDDLNYDQARKVWNATSTITRPWSCNVGRPRTLPKQFASPKTRDSSLQFAAAHTACPATPPLTEA